MILSHQLQGDLAIRGRVHVKATVLDEESGRVKEVAIDYKGRGVLTEKQMSRKSAYLKQVRIE